eukprot:s1012_g9.t1
MASLAALLSPLQVRHLGILARCYALSDPSTRASDVAALLSTTFGEIFPPSDIDIVFANLEANCPHLLGGSPVDLHGRLGSNTVIRPAVTACPDCQQLLVLGPFPAWWLDGCPRSIRQVSTVQGGVLERVATCSAYCGMTAVIPTIWWPFDTTHEGHVLPPLRSVLRRLHFQEHSCDLCRANVVTFDAKYGLACRLCNHREGGLVRFDTINCSVMFGCQAPPRQGGLYCWEHDPGRLQAPGDLPRVLRHRDVDGHRSYKVDGRSTWQSRSDLPPAAVVACEAQLAERTERRKKRRGHAAAASAPVPPPEDDPERQYWDTDEPAMRQQPDEVNPCGIDKAGTQPRRKSTLPCGRVCGATPLAHAESLTQVYALMATLHDSAPSRMKYILYDNACALARYARHPLRATRTAAAVTLAGLTYVLDSFHAANHTACLDSTSSYYLPEVSRNRHAELRGVNSQTAEQFFAWVDPFVRSVVNMTPAVFEVFLLLITHFYNTTICGPSARTPQPRVNFRRNPHGVGFWEAGKYHWEMDPAAPRPPCKIVGHATLTERLQESVDAVHFLPQVGYVIVNPAGKHELCKEVAICEWPLDTLEATKVAWADPAAASTALLLMANLQLLPDRFRIAFALPRPDTPVADAPSLIARIQSLLQVAVQFHREQQLALEPFTGAASG